ARITTNRPEPWTDRSSGRIAPSTRTTTTREIMTPRKSRHSKSRRRAVNTPGSRSAGRPALATGGSYGRRRYYPSHDHRVWLEATPPATLGSSIGRRRTHDPSIRHHSAYSGHRTVRILWDSVRRTTDERHAPAATGTLTLGTDGTGTTPALVAWTQGKSTTKGVGCCTNDISGSGAFAETTASS